MTTYFPQDSCHIHCTNHIQTKHSYVRCYWLKSWNTFLNGTMTILINSYTHSKIAALTLGNSSHPPPTLALFFHLYILHITENTLTYKALHFKGVIEHCSKTEGKLYILISHLATENSYSWVPHSCIFLFIESSMAKAELHSSESPFPAPWSPYKTKLVLVCTQTVYIPSRFSPLSG